MLNYFEIGQRIRTARKLQNLSQEELAEKIGISVTHMSHIETGNTKLSLPVLADLASALYVSADSLLFSPQITAQTLQNEIEQILNSCTQMQASMLTEIMRSIKVVTDKYK